MRGNHLTVERLYKHAIDLKNFAPANLPHKLNKFNALHEILRWFQRYFH